MMHVQDEVEKKMTIETKLIVGFFLVYLASGAVPGLVTYMIDAYVSDGMISDAMIGMISFFVLLILITILAQYLIKWVTRPVRKLCLAAGEMASGNLNVDLKVEASTELLCISESLERMKASLRIAYDWLGPPEIEKYREDSGIMGIGLTEKILMGMVLFLILNPLTAGLAHMLFQDSLYISIIISISFSIILLSLITNYIYQEIIKPLGYVAVLAEKISRGDYSENFEIRHQGDIGRLEHDFKLISERVQRAMKELDMDE